MPLSESPNGETETVRVYTFYIKNEVHTQGFVHVPGLGGVEQDQEMTRQFEAWLRAQEEAEVIKAGSVLEIRFKDVIV